jgi:4-amino-4-deoxy-L-arabinose transferase-like glycosyltransferase
MAAGIVICVYLIARELFDRRSGLWAAAFAALVPPLTYYGSTSNLDVPYLFWTMMATWQLLCAAKYQRLVNYCLCGVLAGLAFATKDQAAGFFVSWPLLVVLLVALHRRTTEPTSNLLRAALDRRVLGAGIAALLAFALGNNLLFGGWEGFLRHLAFVSEFYEANVAHQASGVLGRQPLLLGHSAGLVVQMVGAPVLVLAAGGLVLAWRRRIHSSLLLPLSALTYYVSIIAPTTTLSRYLLGIVLLLIPFAGYAAANSLAATKRVMRLAGTTLTALTLLWQVALVVHLHGMLWNDSRYALERWVRENVPAGTTIESSTQARYLPRLADRYRYSVVGNSFDPISYALLANDLTRERLEERQPPYILVLSDVGLSGDPNRVSEPELRAYYDALLGGRLGYAEVARFETPTWLPYRQLTVGTQPTAILLKRNSAQTNAM